MSDAQNVIPQVCVIPYRRQQQTMEVCLITSLKRGLWIFPKGIIDPGETDLEAALKEAFEEAGLKGRIVGGSLGDYEDSKWDSRLIVQVFLMEVTDVADDWPERDLRERRWVPIQEATGMLEKRVLRYYLSKAARQLKGQDE